MATFVVCQIYFFPSNKHEIDLMKKMTMTKNENNDSFMRDKNIVQAVDSKRKSQCAAQWKGANQPSQTTVRELETSQTEWAAQTTRLADSRSIDHAYPCIPIRIVFYSASMSRPNDASILFPDIFSNKRQKNECTKVSRSNPYIHIPINSLQPLKWAANSCINCQITWKK